MGGGPIGQLAVYPGVGQFIIDNAENSEHVNEGINSVKEFIKAVNNDCKQPQLELINGYLKVLNQEPTVETEKTIKDSIVKHLHLIRVPVMKDVPVRGIHPMWEKHTHVHTVTMVYTSAVPMQPYKDQKCHNGNDWGYLNNKTPFVKFIAKSDLKAQYYGVMKTALDIKKEEIEQNNKTKKMVYLMPLGGGVFCNDPSDIMDAIYNAYDSLYEISDTEDRKILSNALDIQLLTFNRNGEVKDYEPLLHEKNI